MRAKRNIGPNLKLPKGMVKPLVNAVSKRFILSSAAPGREYAVSVKLYPKDTIREMHRRDLGEGFSDSKSGCELTVLSFQAISWIQICVKGQAWSKAPTIGKLEDTSKTESK